MAEHEFNGGSFGAETDSILQKVCEHLANLVLFTLHRDGRQSLGVSDELTITPQCDGSVRRAGACVQGGVVRKSAQVQGNNFQRFCLIQSGQLEEVCDQ